MERCVDDDDVVSISKVQSHIPNDLIFSILSKLSIKSLKRFECVCKSWSLLFDNPNFMNAYRKNLITKIQAYYEDACVLLHKTIDEPLHAHYVEQKFELYLYSTFQNNNNNNNLVKLDWPNVILDRLPPGYDSGFDILGPSGGSVQGTLCLRCVYHEHIVLWNPSTNQFKLIPPSPFHSISYPTVGTIFVYQLVFGYDHINRDYKVMRHIQFPHKFEYNEEFLTNPYFDRESYVDQQIQKHHDFQPELMWEIYSLRTNSWRKLDVDMHHMPKDLEQAQLYMDGLSHWPCTILKDNQTYLVSFDWNKELFSTTTSLPSDINYGYDCHLLPGTLLLLNGSIALMTYNDSDSFNILILGELGVQESWTKIFTVRVSPCLEYPIGTGKKGDILYMKKGGELAWLNLDTQMMEDLGVIMERLLCKMVIHKENLLPFELEGEII